MKNRELIERAFEIMHEPMMKYISGSLRKYCGDEWWNKLMTLLSAEEKKNLPAADAAINDFERLKYLDNTACFEIIISGWKEIFSNELRENMRNWTFELQTNREQNTDAVCSDMSYDESRRVLDTIRRMCKIFDDKLGNSARYENSLTPADEIKQLVEQLDHGEGLSSEEDASEESFDDFVKNDVAEPKIVMPLIGCSGCSISLIVCIAFVWHFREYFSVLFGIIAGLLAVEIISLPEAWNEAKNGFKGAFNDYFKSDRFGGSTWFNDSMALVVVILIGHLFLWENTIAAIFLIAAVSGGIESKKALDCKNMNKLKISAAVTVFAALGYYFTL